MGSPRFAVTPLEDLHRAGYTLAAVYTKPDKPGGRGQEMQFSPVKSAALALGLPVVQPRSLKTGEAPAELAEFKPDVVVVAAYGQILPPAVLALPPLGCLNLHPSLLPRHRGAAPVVSTLLSGDKWGGTSVMLMDEGLDTGPVLARAKLLIRVEDSAGSLADKLSLVSSRLLLDVLPRWAAGKLKPQPQDEAQATLFRTMRKEAGEIDWRLPAVEIWRRVRAFQPWPGAFTHYQGKVIKLIECLPGDCRSAEPPGRVVGLGQGFGVVTGDGVLEVRRVQMEGRQITSAADFLRGQRAFLGALLPD